MVDNFYENLKEAQFRLLRTVTVYDGIPYSVMAITNHKEDGVFRVYLESINWDGKNSIASQVSPVDHLPGDHPQLGAMIDEWMAAEGKPFGVLRKRIDSKHFNNFRPFPLGMCNVGSKTYYVEWSPTRQQYQGLTVNSVISEPVSLTPGGQKWSVQIFSPSLYECVQGTHPDPSECLKNLIDPTIQNEAHAFHRHFAFVRGPIEMMFLAYKSEVIGALPRQDFSVLRLGRNFGYCREAVNDLRLFDTIV